MNINSFEKQQYLIDSLNNELQGLEKKNSKTSIVIAGLIPTLITIVVSFYSSKNSASISEYVTAVFNGLIYYVLTIYAFLWMIEQFEKIVCRREKKIEQLKDLIYILNEILIFN